MLRLVFVAQTRDNKKMRHPLLVPFPRLESKDQQYNIESNAALVSDDEWSVSAGVSDSLREFDWARSKARVHAFKAIRKG